MSPFIADILQKLKNNHYRPGEEEIPGLWESDKTISYSALLNVQKLADVTLLPELIEAFNANRKSADAENILFLISSIVTNSNNDLGMDFLYHLLTTAKNKQFISHCLGFYASRVQLPVKYSMDPLTKLFDSRSKWIRLDSYGAVANSLHVDKESILLQKLSSLETAFEIERILTLLSGFCSNEASPIIEKYVKSKSVKVRQAAKLCLTSIKVRNEVTTESQLNNMPALSKELINLTKGKP